MTRAEEIHAIWCETVGCNCMGEHPEFSSEELVEIRRLAVNEYWKLDHDKNRTAHRVERDNLTERLLTLERIEEKTR